jgi:hypothetical protein
MIKKWQYNNHGSMRDEIKKLIKDNNYTSIDIGATARYWSYPECKHVADSYEPYGYDDINYFYVNIEDKNTWKDIFNYVEKNGKFDFSICSHTLEDVFNPIELIEFLQKISKKGYIAVPSKFNEFTKLFSNKYRGDAHHKQFFDFNDGKIVIYPKFSWIEVDERSNKILENYVANEITFLWDTDIPVKVFGDGKPFIGDDSLINAYYDELLIKK